MEEPLGLLAMPQPRSPPPAQAAHLLKVQIASAIGEHASANPPRLGHIRLKQQAARTHHANPHVEHCVAMVARTNMPQSMQWFPSSNWTVAPPHSLHLASVSAEVDSVRITRSQCAVHTLAIAPVSSGALVAFDRRDVAQISSDITARIASTATARAL